MRADISGRSRAATPSGVRTSTLPGGTAGGVGSGGGFTWETYTPEWNDATGNVLDAGTGGAISGRYRLWPGQHVDLVSVRVVFGTSPTLGDGSAWAFGFPPVPDTTEYVWNLAWDDEILPSPDDKDPDGWGGVATITDPGVLHAPETLLYAGWPVASWAVAPAAEIPGFSIAGYGIELSHAALRWGEEFPFDNYDGNDLVDGYVLRASVYGRFIRQEID